jgi:uncharacterized protein (DUF2141 family)
MSKAIRCTLRTGLAACVVVVTAAASPATFKVSGKVTGGSGKHAILIALWDADGFLKTPVQRARFEAGAATDFHFDVAPGRWALSSFEDVNGNGVLDMGMFGPKEPSGFFKPFTAWRAPKFEDVAFAVDRDIVNADVSLK